MRDFSSRRTAHWYSALRISTVIRNRRFPGLDDTRDPRPQIISIGWGKVLAIRWWSNVRGGMLLCWGFKVEGDKWTSEGVPIHWLKLMDFRDTAESIEQWDSDDMEGCRWLSIRKWLLSIFSISQSFPSLRISFEDEKQPQPNLTNRDGDYSDAGDVVSYFLSTTDCWKWNVGFFGSKFGGIFEWAGPDNRSTDHTRNGLCFGFISAITLKNITEHLFDCQIWSQKNAACLYLESKRWKCKVTSFATLGEPPHLRSSSPS